MMFAAVAILGERLEAGWKAELSDIGSPNYDDVGCSLG
jgi:hypothetical protein